jgi:hypothetical protein
MYNMEKVPTALELFQKGEFTKIQDAMIEFAKIHVQAAIKEASEKAKLAKAFDYGSYYEPTAKFKPIDEKVVVKESYGHGDSGYEAVKVDVDSILKSYSLDNIK